MATTFGFYLNSSKTLPITTAAVFSINAGDGVPVDTIIYFGSTTASRKCQAASSPGFDTIKVMIEDAAVGSGQPATAVKLALSANGLNSASPGAQLDLGVSQVLSSQLGIPIYVRVTDQTGVVGNYTDLAIKTNDLFETTV